MNKNSGEYRATDNVNPVFSDFILSDPPEKRKVADLNQILGKVLGQLTDDSRASVIRCDELPVVRGNEEQLTHAFQYIINFILSSPPENKTLFLYIKCEPARIDYIDMTISNDEKRYRVSFYTNSDAQSGDFPGEQKNICTRSLENIKGKFTLNSQPGTGWLFTLEVPGKLK